MDLGKRGGGRKLEGVEGGETDWDVLYEGGIDFQYVLLTAWLVIAAHTSNSSA